MQGSETTGKIQGHLAAIYGSEAAAELWPRVRRIMEEGRPAATRSSTAARPLPLTERDSLLITYGDQVSQPDEAPLVTLRRFAEHRLKTVVSGIHILPHFPFTSDDGFSVTDYFAVNPELGSWDDVKALGGSFDLMFDAVFNHMSAQGEWFQRFLAGDPSRRDFFVTVEGSPDLSRVVRPRALPLLTEFQAGDGPRKVWTTFSADQVDLNFRNPEVLLETLRALLLYVRNGARFIRLDAIAYLWKEIGTSCIHLPQTHRVIQFWRDVLDELQTGTMLITETNVPHADNISYFGDGRNEAHLVYNFALPPLVLHALLRGDASHLNSWAAGLSLPSDGVSFFNFLASHDGIGLNPARGILPQAEIDLLVETCLARGGLINYKHNADGTRSPYEMNIVYFDALNDPSASERIDLQVRRFMVAQAVMLALRGMPGIYFHSLFGSRNDRRAADETGINRRINRRKFTLEEIEGELSREDSLPASVYRAYSSLLAARASHPGFSPLASQEVLQMDPRIFALARRSPEGPEALALHNLSASRVEISLPRGSGRLEILHRIGGELPVDFAQGRVVLNAYETLWLSRHSHGERGVHPASE